MRLVTSDSAPPPPKRIVFDTDIGSDVDDGLALSLIHAMIGRGELDLLAVTSTNASGLEVSRELAYTDTYKAVAPQYYVGVMERETN